MVATPREVRKIKKKIKKRKKEREDLEMKKLLLVCVVLVVLILSIAFLTGCYCCPTCSPVSQDCFLRIKAGYGVWGGVNINGQSTEEWIDFQGIEGDEFVTINVPCGEIVEVKIVDACGFESHTELLYISPGYNYLDFSYWKNIDKLNDVHYRCSL